MSDTLDVNIHPPKPGHRTRPLEKGTTKKGPKAKPAIADGKSKGEK